MQKLQTMRDDCMKGIIDRFEEKLAVVELDSGEMTTVDRRRLPEDADEGMVIEFTDFDIQIDYKETERRRAANQNLIDLLLQETTD
jgi:hypothetical protein